MCVWGGCGRGTEVQSVDINDGECVERGALSPCYLPNMFCSKSALSGAH